MNESIDLEQCPVMVALYDDIGWNLFRRATQIKNNN